MEFKRPDHLTVGFNPRPRTGGRQMRFRWKVWSTGWVSIHAPVRGGDLHSLGAASKENPFQSTPPYGGRRSRSLITVRANRRFNPRPRTGGDGDDSMLTPGHVVSIHAPVRGATRSRTRSARRRCGFNPRPRTGGDMRRLVHGDLDHAFQSTPPYGGRQVVSIMPEDRTGVSIHAPVRGATKRCWWTELRYFSFNPRPRTGGDWWWRAFQ